MSQITFHTDNTEIKEQLSMLVPHAQSPIINPEVFPADPTPDHTPELAADIPTQSEIDKDTAEMPKPSSVEVEDTAPLTLSERLDQKGADSLIDAELFAVLTQTTLKTAQKVITEFGGNLMKMANACPARFRMIKGIGDKKAAQIVAAFEIGKRLARFHADKDKITSPTDVADILMSRLRYLQKEVVVCLTLDTKGGITAEGTEGEDADALQWGTPIKVTGQETIFEGTLNASVFHPREIFRFAILENANSIVLVHNHPSGDPQPSQEDIKATKQLIEAGNQIGIKVLDHVIIGDGIFVSLKEEGFI